MKKTLSPQCLVRYLGIIAVVMLAGVVGCATPIAFKDFDQSVIKEGMSTLEVEQLIGPPENKERLGNAGITASLVYKYVGRVSAGGEKILYKELLLLFEDDRLTKKVYFDKLILRSEKFSRPSNNIIQIN